jgi:hypothetical protein
VIDNLLNHPLIRLATHLDDRLPIFHWLWMSLWRYALAQSLRRVDVCMGDPQIQHALASESVRKHI